MSSLPTSMRGTSAPERGGIPQAESATATEDDPNQEYPKRHAEQPAVEVLAKDLVLDRASRELLCRRRRKRSDQMGELPDQCEGTVKDPNKLAGISGH